MAAVKFSEWATKQFGLGRISSSVIDGATAVAHTFDTENDISTAGAKLLCIKNQGVEKFSVGKDGQLDGATLIIENLPTTDPGIAGAIWNNSGVLNVSAG